MLGINNRSQCCLLHNIDILLGTRRRWRNLKVSTKWQSKMNFTIGKENKKSDVFIIIIVLVELSIAYFYYLFYSSIYAIKEQSVSILQILKSI